MPSRRKQQGTGDCAYRREHRLFFLTDAEHRRKRGVKKPRDCSLRRERRVSFLAGTSYQQKQRVKTAAPEPAGTRARLGRARDAHCLRGPLRATRGELFAGCFLSVER